MSRARSRLVAALALSLVGACTSSPDPLANNKGAAGSGAAGSHGQGAAGSGSPGAAGSGTPGGAAGSDSSGAAGDGSGSAGAGSPGAAGAGSAGTPGGGDAGSMAGGGGPAGAPGAAGAGGSPGAGGKGGTPGTAGAPVTGTGGASSAECDPPPPRPINVTGTGTFSMSFNGQPLYLNKDKKPIQGKLFLLMPGIGNGPGAGGFESFVKQYGFHVFAPKTDTNLTGGKVPQSYKDTLKTNPTDHEANRQVADARMELWDGVDRVSWYTPPPSIVSETVDAIKLAMQADPGGDWGFFLDDAGKLRTTDVWVVGYSWGAQTWAMISSYVRFGRVISASGPVNEGFPNGAWMTDPSATPVSCKYALVSDGQATEIFPNVQKAGWPGDIVMVHTTSPGPYTVGQHLFEMIGGDGGTTPGGHTVFCNDNPANGWLPVCKHVLGQDQ
jgi:hypothetical protein